ncbi:hypothetical protein JZ751_022179 [Albula glossodonta]|uniref:SUZ-C domain-containing protein n=1 Tax=Albula glossodonta TaxID=121402 RepID=A0A8T2MSX9_9TELE|nr:hypothetical protein JZ751_022179 [Albula glossodonta]
MRTPVCVSRLPRGPDPNSRGFDPKSPRYIALCPTTIAASSASHLDSCSLQEEQRTRSILRERYLRSLLAMSQKQVRFNMYERVRVEAKFGASDIDVLNFQEQILEERGGVQRLHSRGKHPDVLLHRRVQLSLRGTESVKNFSSNLGTSDRCE